MVVMVQIALQEKRVATTETKSHLQFWRSFSANHNQVHVTLSQKKAKIFPFVA